MSEEAGKGAARAKSQDISNPNMIQEGSKGPKQQKSNRRGKRVNQKNSQGRNRSHQLDTLTPRMPQESNMGEAKATC